MEQTITGSVKIIEIPYKVDKPVFKDVDVKVPRFIEEQVKVPTGWDKVINEIALEISHGLYNEIERLVNEKMTTMITERLKEVVVPKIIEREEVKVTVKDVEVLNAVVKDVPVTNAVITDKEVTNCVIVDKTVINAVIEDVHVKNAVIEDVAIKNFVLTPERV